MSQGRLNHLMMLSVHRLNGQTRSNRYSKQFCFWHWKSSLYFSVIFDGFVVFVHSICPVSLGFPVWYWFCSWPDHPKYTWETATSTMAWPSKTSLQCSWYVYACVVNNHRLFCEVSTLNSYFLNLIVVLASKGTVFILGIAQHIKENLCCYCTISPYGAEMTLDFEEAFPFCIRCKGPSSSAHHSCCTDWYS